MIDSPPVTRSPALTRTCVATGMYRSMRDPNRISPYRSPRATRSPSDSQQTIRLGGHFPRERVRRQFGFGEETRLAGIGHAGFSGRRCWQCWATRSLANVASDCKERPLIRISHGLVVEGTPSRTLAAC